MEAPTLLPKVLQTIAPTLALPVELAECIAKFGGLRVASRLRRVCRAWADASLYALTCANPEEVFGALLRAPATFWASADAARVCGILVELPLSRAEITAHFRRAVYNGAKDYLAWFCTAFALTRAEAFAPYFETFHGFPDIAFVFAARYGHVAVLEFLADTFELTAEEVRADYFGAFKYAAKTVTWKSSSVSRPDSR